MKEIVSMPFPVKRQENVRIPMPDGVHLSARIWMPENAENEPVPAILEYIPYRKRDLTRDEDELNHPYFAGHGYAAVRVDLRGSGESEGILEDEYLPIEQEDGLEVLRWLSDQPWCDGNVGMIGISWGGFNGLQLAALDPPELKAVISVCSTDDRYADDVHYMGGCLLGDNLSWAATMFGYNSCPPDPELVGEKWRELWLERLEGSGMWLEHWLQHQRRNAYWKQGSICEDFSSVRTPIMAVSGWADGYSNAVFRMMENLESPFKGLVGPWGHKYPHLGKPGPAIGFLQEALRWWDYWLKGKETGIMEEPRLRAWMQKSVPPTTALTLSPGYWVAEDEWPSSHIEKRRYSLEPGWIRPEGEAASKTPLSLQSPLSVGLFAGKWCSFSATPDLPHDQREEDGGALVFESDPLQEEIEILGSPVVELELSSSKPVAMVAVRLSDVAPDDATTRVTYGLLNLTHRNSHEHPEQLEPGRHYRIPVRLNNIAQTFPEGHRLRISISTSYWPLAWPPPEAVRLTIFAGASSLILPIREPRREDADLHPFPEPEATPELKTTLLEPMDYDWVVHRDLARDISTLEVIKDEGTYRIEEIDLEVQRKVIEWYSYKGNDFESPRGETYCERGFRRGDWKVLTITRTVLTADAEEFHFQADLDAYEGRKRVFCKSWDRRIPRDHI
ncbi:MAG: CocE/NonD family hydrolase [Desulfuromonadales bacterium]